jgi:hypothetical protein
MAAFHMTLRIVARTRQKSDTSRIPDILTLGTAILAGLSERDILAKFEKWAPIKIGDLCRQSKH